MERNIELVNKLTLSRLTYFQQGGATKECEHFGSATAAMEARSDMARARLRGANGSDSALKAIEAARQKAEEELAFAEKAGIKVLAWGDADYPQRLKGCDDAPLVLFSKGNATLNVPRAVSIVGTRNCTQYGQDFIKKLVEELSAMCPQLLIVSGLAYGVDIHAHREAMDNKLPTVAVLAHGLDRIYPSLHRPDAVRMVEHGALLTEYFTGTRPDKLNFLRRNRIVAGLTDATVVIESASHGGALATARIAKDYGRQVMAVPGRATDTYSQGCNKIIRDRQATLITSAADLMFILQWADEAQMAQKRKAGIELSLFPDLTEEEQQLVNLLQTEGDLQLNSMTMKTSQPVNQVAANLFSLEMKGVVRVLEGGIYHLISS